MLEPLEKNDVPTVVGYTYSATSLGGFYEILGGRPQSRSHDQK